MSYCSNCGAPMKDGARFCPNCGHQVNTPQGQSNESFWNAAAEPGEVVLSSWENPKPQPTPQPQVQQQAQPQYQPQYQPQAQPTQRRASSSQPQKSYRENLTESIKASAEERHREEEARSRSSRGCGIAVIILIIAVVLLAIFL